MAHTQILISTTAKNEDFGPVSRTYLTRSLVPSEAQARHVLVNVIFLTSILGSLMEICACLVN